MKKLNRYTIYLLVVISASLASCGTQRVSTIVGCEYDVKKNQTDYIVFPYGKASIPGRWVKTHYYSVNTQQFFTNTDKTVNIAIAFQRFDSYEFNQDGSKKGFDFVNAYYEWDSKYFMEKFGCNRNVIESDSLRNYIIYRIFNSNEVDTYFLIGEKNGNISNFSIHNTDEWNVKEKIEFIKMLFIESIEE